jgi:hypothetical protein
LGRSQSVEVLFEGGGEAVEHHPARSSDGLQLSEMAAVSEDDVAEDEQAPAIAEHLDSGVDRAPDRGLYPCP